MSQKPGERRRFPWADLVGGAGAGALSVFVVSPLEVARTRLQVQRVPLGGAQPHYKGTVGTIRTIAAEEGLRGLYTGLTPNILALVPNWSVFFVTNEAVKAELSAAGWKPGPAMHVSAASAAAAVTAMATTPFWVVKTRMQTQDSFEAMRKFGRLEAPLQPRTHYRNSWHCFRTIIAEEGVRRLWSGLLAQLVGVVHVAVQFPLYEDFKSRLSARAAATNQGRARPLNAAELMVASSTAKIIATMAAYPHEVIRARFQSARSSDPLQYQSLRHACQTILKEEGPRGFYRGLSTTLVRAVPSCAITFTAYELIQRRAKQWLG